MNIVFLKLYITEDTGDKFYNSQETGLAKALVSRDPANRVHIILLSKSVSEKEDREISDRITVHIYPAKGIGHHGRLHPSVLCEYEPDLVHILADNMLYAPNVINYFLRHDIKCHLYIGTLYTDSSKGYQRAISRLLMMRNIRAYRKVPVYTKTPAVLDECKEKGINAMLAPVGLGENATILSTDSKDEIRRRYDLPADKKILLFVGRFEEYKHPLDAVKLLNSMDDVFYLLMIGKGPLTEDVRLEIQKQGLEKRIKLIDRLPNSEMRHIYRACDFYINFNPDEIYGMAILEAMCHECPVFAISASGPEFLIDDGKTGFICSSPDDMAKRIIETAGDDELIEVVKTGARSKVLNNFTWDKTVQCFEDF